jgi:hypothetical protein
MFTKYSYRVNVVEPVEFARRHVHSKKVATGLLLDVLLHLPLF